MQMILVEHFLRLADDGWAILMDFHSPTTFSPQNEK
jgi:hypothetical protein